MNEGALDKRQVSLRVRIELVRKTVKNFGREEDGTDVSPSIVRALEEATRGVPFNEWATRYLANRKAR